MKRSFVAGFALAAVIGPAAAADMPLKAPPPPEVVSWTGLYIGANVGGGWGRSSWCTDAARVSCLSAIPVDVGVDRAGGTLFGGQVEARWQFSNWVIGAGAMFDAMKMAPHDFSCLSSSTTAPCGGIAIANRVRTTSFNNLYSATGQLGYAWGSVLAYGKGGWAGSRIDFGENNTVIGGANLVSDVSADGWTAGTGVEYMAGPHLTVGLEYGYYQFEHGTNILNIRNTAAVLIPCAFCNINSTVQSLTARMNYKF
jgi:outer membrane immunogenic protein